MDIETLLRNDLAGRAGDVKVAEDPWPTFERREVRHRRAKRVRVAAAGLALVGAFGLQSGLVPMPGWAPAIATASSNDDLINSPVRGSLAGDTAWLEGMRAHVHDLKEDEGLWQVQRDKLKFLYASDVGAMRIAVAYVPLRLGMLSSAQLVWFRGAAGAAPEAMEQGGNDDAAARATASLEMSPDGTNIIVVVGPLGSTAGVSEGYSYTPEGQLRMDPHVGGSVGSGIAEVVLQPSQLMGATAQVEYEGRVDQIELGGSWDDDDPTGEKLDAAVTEALGESTFDRSMLHSWVSSAVMMAAVSVDGLKVDLRWAGSVNGQDAALITLQEPGQGVLAFAFHGQESSFRQDLGAVMPAAGAEDRPIAWRMRQDGGDTKTDQVVVVAPVKADSLKLEVAGQPPVPVVLDQAGKAEVAVAPNQEASVVAYRADGSELSRSPVLPFEDGDTLIGETAATRLGP